MTEMTITAPERTGDFRSMLNDEYEAAKVLKNKVKEYYLSISPMLGSKKNVSIPITKEMEENINAFFSQSTGVWEDLMPLMKGKPSYAEFMVFDKFCHRLDLGKEDVPKCFELMEIIRMAWNVLELDRIDKEIK